ncbi:DUF5985 family protein [Noviherbaspirillum aerium]|uniref:DUF5985 family protein n=1 Tax=Noviherbaspirillum aerium TaxID=2588497 RepID=UPI00124D0F89|nr:DUF5985 family protein [Noviherbaspirillum aerium]
MDEILIGAIAMGSFIAALFFLRFWKSTGDRLFMYFALAFIVEGANRLLLGGILRMSATTENYSIYVLRLVSYTLILAGIWLKNRGGKKRG